MTLPRRNGDLAATCIYLGLFAYVAEINVCQTNAGSSHRGASDDNDSIRPFLPEKPLPKSRALVSLGPRLIKAERTSHAAYWKDGDRDRRGLGLWRRYRAALCRGRRTGARRRYQCRGRLARGGGPWRHRPYLR